HVHRRRGAARRDGARRERSARDPRRTDRSDAVAALRMMALLRDLRFGVRILRRHPSYACAAVAVMALGVGATTAVFSVLRGVLITRLPYREPSQLVLFRADLPGVAHQAALTSDEYRALESRTDL